jgi:hypothetical protein
MLLPLLSPLDDHIDSARASGQNKNMVGLVVAEHLCVAHVPSAPCLNGPNSLGSLDTG